MKLLRRAASARVWPSSTARNAATAEPSIGSKPQHYPYVADALLPAIRDVLGGAATDEIIDAWGQAYWFLADILIGKEAELYAEAEKDLEPA